MIYTIAAVGLVLLSIVYLIDNRLHIWPRGMFSSTVEYHPTELEDSHQVYMREVRQAMESNDNI